jgi:hypothetical protein
MQDKIDCFSDTHRYMQQRMLEYIPQEKLQQSRGILSRLMYKLRLSDGRMAQYSADVIPGYICERYPQACVIAFHIVRGLSRYLEYGMPEQELFLARNWKTSNRAPKFSPSVHTFNAETQNFIQQQWKSIELNEKMFYILDMGSACAPELFGILSAIQFLRSRSLTGSMNSIGADLIAVDRVAEWEPFLDISTKVMIELGFNIRMNFKVVDLRNPDGLFPTQSKRKWIIWWSFIITENDTGNVLNEAIRAVASQCQIGSLLFMQDRNQQGLIALMNTLFRDGFAVIYEFHISRGKIQTDRSYAPST